MKIGLDAMGGDFGIPVNIQATLLSLKEYPQIKKIVLVGQSDQIKKELDKQNIESSKIEIVNAEQEITMKDSPSMAIRQKQDSSIAVMYDLHKQKEVDAVISAGNTGAMMAFALKKLGRLPGINRPGIAIAIPTAQKDPVILMDVGANANCKVKNLVEFAFMASVFTEEVIGITNPKLGLISVGEESSKGNEMTISAHQLLQKTPYINFQGNAEGSDIHTGEFNIIVMDGFVGNIILKHSESVFSLITGILKESIRKNWLCKIGALLMKPAFNSMKQQLDYESYGGAALLGVKGNCIISHGKSTPIALKNAIKEALYLVEHRVNEKIKEKLANINLEE